MRTSTLSVTFFALFCGLMLSSTSVSASVTTSLAGPPSPKETPPAFGISAGLSKSFSLVDHKDGDRQETNDLEVIPSYNWSFGKTLAVFTFSDDVRDPGNSDMGDIALATSFNGWDFKSFKLRPSVTIVLPQSKESRINTNLQTAISGKLSASIQEKLLLPGFRFGGSVSFNRNFHRYETALDGTVLKQYSSKQGLSGGYSIGLFSFDLDFTHINAWTYQGNMKESYEHSEEASVEIGRNFAFTLGHTNGGSVFKEDGYSSNYKLIDEENSLVYAKVSMQY
ncbi:MAG: hypothetical protein JSU04_07720 [Bdellovibrionales bacterium]|nr:hypothetical protein [Bdellovibrionales bacterium]